MDEEIWRAIKGFEGLYEVSNLGRVRSLGNGCSNNSKERILSPSNNGGDYLRINLCKNGPRKNYYIHRLVLSTFNPVDDMENLEVNHIDEDKTNNNLNNLEWTTHGENINHGTRNDRVAEKLRGTTFSEEHKKKISESRSIPIVQIDPSTNKVVNVWGSSRYAEREGGFNNSNIIACCKNKFHREGNNIHKGYRWQYLHVYISKIDPRIKKVILFNKEYEF